MTAVAVVGYASLDHAMAVEGLPEPDRSAVVERRLSAPWPAVGGAAHVAGALAGDARVDLITWVGDDEPGRRYVRDVERAGVRTAAVAASLERTPSSYLFYDRDGRAACFFDPGGAVAGLTPAQAAAIARCDWLCVTVGPRAATEAALGVLPAGAALAWVVKGDRIAFVPTLVRRCLQRARLVSFSRGERAFLHEQAAPDDPLDLVCDDALVVETRGGDGVWHRSPDGEGVVAVERVTAGDTTGAGDTFAGRLLAGVVAGAGPADAVRDAAAATTRFLLSRHLRGHL